MQHRATHMLNNHQRPDAIQARLILANTSAMATNTLLVPKSLLIMATKSKYSAVAQKLPITSLVIKLTMPCSSLL